MRPRSRISGCSTDSSVRFIKDLGARFGVDFFNRTNLAFLIQDKTQLLPMNQLHYAMDNYFINGDTLYFNNLVQTKKDLENHWIIPVKDSWISKKLIPYQRINFSSSPYFFAANLFTAR